MKASEYQDIGQYLRDSRESLRITLARASFDLNIRVKYLEAIETGNLSDMPGKAYIRGYIRNYAHYLKLDVDEVLDAYGLVLGHKSHELFIPAQTIEQHLPSRTLAGLSVAALFLLYGWWYFHFYDRYTMDQTVPNLPQRFMRMLDKTPPLQLTKPWMDCLNNADASCAILLQLETLKPFYAPSYPLQALMAPPRIPEPRHDKPKEAPRDTDDE